MQARSVYVAGFEKTPNHGTSSGEITALPDEQSSSLKRKSVENDTHQ
jgi:hypothetical protein